MTHPIDTPSASSDTGAKYTFFTCATGLLALASAYEKASFSFDFMLHHLFSSTWSLLVLLHGFGFLLIHLFQLFLTSTIGSLKSVEGKHIREIAFQFVLVRCILLFNKVNVAPDSYVLMIVGWIATLTFLHSLLTAMRLRVVDIEHGVTRRFQSLMVGTAVALLCLCRWSMFTFYGSDIFYIVSTSECALLAIQWLQVGLLLHIETSASNQVDDKAFESKESFANVLHMALEVASLFIKVAQFGWIRSFDDTWQVSFMDFVIVFNGRQICASVYRQFNQWQYMQEISSAFDQTFQLVVGINDNCVICLHPMPVATKLDCGHHFHRRCLRQCLEENFKQRSNTPWRCAVCRKEVHFKTNIPHTEEGESEAALWPLGN